MAALGRLATTVAFAGGLALLISLLGTRDQESYEHAFFSLNRGTAVQAVQVLGHPVYTLSVGFGVRLPLHGSLGASPAAAVAPFMPAPLTYWLLITFAIGTAVLIVRHALEPLCGRRLSWFAPVLLFCSAPMVNYTIYDDWPETAITYCAFVACVFAPHAILALGDSGSATARRLGGLAVAAAMSGLIGAAHAGYWPLLAASLALAAVLTLLRSDHGIGRRLFAIALLAIAASLAVAPQIPDITREIAAAENWDMRRLTEGARGTLTGANAFPFGPAGARLPYTFLALAAVSLVIGATSRDARARRLSTGGALASILFGVGATAVPEIESSYAPSVLWAMRDPAIAFAVLGAAGAVRGLSGLPADSRRRVVAILAITIAGLQGLAYSATLVATGTPQSVRSWTRDMTAPGVRASRRGLTPAQAPPGERLALWAGVREQTRNGSRASTDFADAGYPLVTAWTKQRTMRGLVEPNDLLFNQSITLSPAVLCDPGAVSFLRLRYLLMPGDVECAPWRRLPDVQVDEWLDLGVARERDDFARSIAIERLSSPAALEPALSEGASLLADLTPQPWARWNVAGDGLALAVMVDDPARMRGLALVLPVAYDPAWRASSGRTHGVGGLMALSEIDRRQVTLTFVPDSTAVLRALGMTIAQLLAAAGFLGLAVVGQRFTSIN